MSTTEVKNTTSQVLANTGINPASAEQISGKLNELLSDLHVFYMNLRGLHWNISGKEFFKYHEKFEELYEDVAGKIDEVAERVLSLGTTPLHSFKDYLSHANLQEVKDVSQTGKAVEAVLAGLKDLLKKEREILELTDELNDEASNSLMSDYITEHEKIVWMYAASSHK